MMRNTKKLAITWLLLSFTFLFPLETEAIVREKTFPVPLKTVQRAVTTWLKSTGFHFKTTTKSNPYQTDIKAEKETEQWHILIRPQSSLASHLTATWTGLDWVTPDAAVDPHKQLWTGIQKNIQSPTNRTDNSTHPAIPEAVYAHIKAIVCIHVTSGGTQKQVSGFFINARENLLISTAHDLMAFQEITVGLADGRDIPGQVVQLDPDIDLALIRVESSSPTSISLSQSRNLLNLGDELYTIGCPVNHGGMVTPGIVNAPPRRAAGQLLWQVNMEILPGNSGSPVFDDQGRLVAVVKGRHRVKPSIGFLIPMETLITFIKTNIDYVRLAPWGK
jgi:serine protease Do